MSGVDKILEAAAIARKNRRIEMDNYSMQPKDIQDSQRLDEAVESLSNHGSDCGQTTRSDSSVLDFEQLMSKIGGPSSFYNGSPALLQPRMVEYHEAPSKEVKASSPVDLARFSTLIGESSAVYSLYDANKSEERPDTESSLSNPNASSPDLSRFVTQLGGASVVYSTHDKGNKRETHIVSKETKPSVGAKSVLKKKDTEQGLQTSALTQLLDERDREVQDRILNSVLPKDELEQGLQATALSQLLDERGRELQDRALLLRTLGSGSPTSLLSPVGKRRQNFLRSENVHKQLLASQLRETLLAPVSGSLMTQTELNILKQAEEEASKAHARLSMGAVANSKYASLGADIPFQSGHPLHGPNPRNNEKAKNFKLRANPSFPEKLMALLLDDPAPDVVAWLPHGNSFIILRPDIFVTDILPKYFKPSKFASFARKLHRWGFVRIMRGMDTGAYYHKLFKRDEPELCCQFGCQENDAKEDAKKSGSSEKVHVKKDGCGTQSTPEPVEKVQHRPVSPVEDDLEDVQRSKRSGSGLSNGNAPLRKKLKKDARIEESPSITQETPSVNNILNRVLHLNSLYEQSHAAAFMLAAYQEESKHENPVV